MYAENNCAEVVLNKQRCLWGAIIFFQIGGHEKSWGHRFFFLFSVKSIGVSTWNKQEIIGWLQILLKFVFNDNPSMQIFHATRNGGCIIGL